MQATKNVRATGVNDASSRHRCDKGDASTVPTSLAHQPAWTGMEEGGLERKPATTALGPQTANETVAEEQLHEEPHAEAGVVGEPTAARREEAVEPSTPPRPQEASTPSEELPPPPSTPFSFAAGGSPFKNQTLEELHRVRAERDALALESKELRRQLNRARVERAKAGLALEQASEATRRVMLPRTQLAAVMLLSYVKGRMDQDAQEMEWFIQ